MELERELGFEDIGVFIGDEPMETVGEVAVLKKVPPCADTPTGPLVFKLATPGTHFAMNGLGALAAAQAAGADLAVCATDLAGWHPLAGRGARETVRLDKGDPDVTLDLIDDSYNANPASMGAALDMLAAAANNDDG